MDVLGEKFHSLLNVTIVYPGGIPTFWNFLRGQVKRVVVRFQAMEVPKQLLQGDYAGDKNFRVTFHRWVHQLWQEKDRQIAILMKEAGVL